MENIVLQKKIASSLATYQDPYLKTDLVTAKAIKQILATETLISIQIVLGYPHLGVEQELIQKLTEHLSPLITAQTLQINVNSQIHAHTGRAGIPRLPEIKNIIAVASGKGGVGKSTVAINLVLSLVKQGAKVGILDADIYGPSQPMILGAVGKRPELIGKSLQPITCFGVQSMSIGYLIDETAAMVWRGPMIGKAMQQLIHDTAWQNLDYLIIDLPPGTGDIQLTLCQKMPLSGVVIVTTPQDLALSDVRRACEMFNKMNVPILGVIENMSVYHCPQCGHEEHIFGKEGATSLLQQFDLALLGSVPLRTRIRELTDSGQPLIVKEPESTDALIFYQIARKVSALLSLQTKDYSASFPKVVVQQTAANIRGVEGK